MKRVNNSNTKDENSNLDNDWMNQPIFSKESIENSIILKIIVEIIMLIGIYFFLKIAEGEVTLFSYLSFVAGYFLIGFIRRNIKKRKENKK